jgi:hypothetical protein
MADKTQKEIAFSEKVAATGFPTMTSSEKFPTVPPAFVTEKQVNAVNFIFLLLYFTKVGKSIINCTQIKLYLCSTYMKDLSIYVITEPNIESYHPIGIYPIYTLPELDLTTHSSSLLGGRRRRYH